MNLPAGPHLFVDVSAHGLGHLAQTAPVLDELRALMPAMRLTLRSALPEARLRQRIGGDFDYLPGGSDFGFVMRDATRIDLPATAACYRQFHALWEPRVDSEAEALSRLSPDLVLTNVAYLPLAGAARAGVPAMSLCSLNWADLFAHFFAAEDWARPIHAEILAAYRSAECFLRPEPAMPMTALPRSRAIPPLAALGAERRAALRALLGCAPEERLVLVAYGGFARPLPCADWPLLSGVRWLFPGVAPVDRPDMSGAGAWPAPFAELLASVDAVLTKPGYGTFVEAACGGIPVLYERRDDWPEQDCLIDWLKINARAVEVGADILISGGFRAALTTLWQQEPPPRPVATGAARAAHLIAARLTGSTRGDGPA